MKFFNKSETDIKVKYLVKRIKKHKNTERAILEMLVKYDYEKLLKFTDVEKIVDDILEYEKRQD